MTEAAPDLIPHALYKVIFHFPDVLREPQAQALFEALDELGVSVFLQNRDATDGDDWAVSVTTYGAPDLDAIYNAIAKVDSVKITRDKISAEKLPETDWLQHVHENFPPVTIGRFFVYGSHVKQETPKGLIPLQIDAATAFGSGEHETTKGCMLSFDWMVEQGLKADSALNALDMGCGSGILAIAITKVWPKAKVTAIDIDPESVVVTNRHAELNGAGNAITTAAGDGYNTPRCQQNAPYDLIAANILAGPLIEMAPQLNAALKPGGYAVLSGLLGRQQADVTAAHVAQGLKPVHALELGDWRALTFLKP